MGRSAVGHTLHALGQTEDAQPVGLEKSVSSRLHARTCAAGARCQSYLNIAVAGIYVCVGLALQRRQHVVVARATRHQRGGCKAKYPQVFLHK